MTTIKSPWRETGNTDLSSFTKALQRSWQSGVSPMTNEASSVFDILSRYGLTRLGAAQAWIETKNGSYNCDNASEPPCIPSVNRNPWAMSLSMENGVHRWASYDSYADAARDYVTRLLGEGPYADTKTIEQYILIYAPPFDGNESIKYAQELAKGIDAMPLVGKEPTAVNEYVEHSLAGSSVKLRLPSDVPFRINLIRVGQTNQRPGISMKPTYYTQHETGNSGVGAGAKMHEQWLHGGASGVQDAQVGFHFVVDDKEVIQLLPVNEVAWHAGDGAGPGNYSSIGCELCVNADRNVAKAERNAEALAGGVMAALAIPKGGLRTHWSWVAGRPGAHYCPEVLLNSGRINEFIRQAELFRTESGGVVVPPTTVMVLPFLDEKEVKANYFPEYDPQGMVSRGWVARCRKYGRVMPRTRFLTATTLYDKAYEFDGGLTCYIMKNGTLIWTDEEGWK